MTNPYTEYLLRIADNNLIIGQRLAEWCGHGPALEEDIAMSNMALDLIGQATIIYAHLAEATPDRSEDDWAFLRNEDHYHNVQLAELPNGDFARTMARQYFYSAFYHRQLGQLILAEDAFLRAFAVKAIKEIAYHERHCREWMLRLGDGTPMSHAKLTNAIEELWEYTGEPFIADATDAAIAQHCPAANLETLKSDWYAAVNTTLAEATLPIPTDRWMQRGGKQGRHTEHLGYILAEMQFLPRAYPGAKW